MGCGEGRRGGQINVINVIVPLHCTECNPPAKEKETGCSNTNSTYSILLIVIFLDAKQ